MFQFVGLNCRTNIFYKPPSFQWQKNINMRFFMLNLLVRLTGGVSVIKALAETIPQMSVLSKCFNF